MQLSKFKFFSDKLSADEKIFMLWLLTGLLLWMGYAGLIAFYRRGWQKARERTRTTEELPFLSVLVPARNEARNLPLLLQALKEQDYPAHKYEVLVLDDHSEDGTAALAAAAGANVRVLQLPEALAGKKAAIAYGVAHARGSWIVTTDADCRPGARWLSLLATNTSGASFIAAPVRYSAPRSFCDRFQTLDFLTLQGITAASVATGFHSMCNGANLAYSKEAFKAVGGFAGVDHVASGDDLLLMHKIALRYPGGLRYLREPGAIVDTDPAPGWRAFWKQRVRWASKSAQYDDKRIFWALVLVYVFNVFLAALVGASLFRPQLWAVLLLLLLLKILVEIRFLIPVTRFFGQQELLWWFPLMQPLHIAYTVLVGALSQVGTYEWKGRKVR
jgi:biofilm PGA synthesis N-glycosyltransferase PgaC